MGIKGDDYGWISLHAGVSHIDKGVVYSKKLGRVCSRVRLVVRFLPWRPLIYARKVTAAATGLPFGFRSSGITDRPS